MQDTYQVGRKKQNNSFISQKMKHIMSEVKLFVVFFFFFFLVLKTLDGSMVKYSVKYQFQIRYRLPQGIFKLA